MANDPLDVAAWSEFAVALAGVAAVLAGLVFVGLSLNLARILTIPGLRGRAGESVIILIGAVVQCAFLLLPDQATVALGIELVAVGALEASLLLGLSASALRLPTRQPVTWQMTRLVSGQLAALPAVVAGALALTESGVSLFFLAGAIIWAIGSATASAWVLVVEVVNDDRYAPPLGS